MATATSDDFKKIASDFAPPKDTTRGALPVVGEKTGGRLQFLDGLRGIAALLVMLFHFYSPKVSQLNFYLRPVTPAAVRLLLTNAYAGVEIFFVLSGFVIAYTLRNEICTLRFAGNFMVRRCIRLDLPFWTVIFIAVGYRCFLWHHYTGDILGAWGVGTILANMFYVNDLLHLPRALGISWTLCLEVQFYLAIIVILMVVQQARRFISDRAANGALFLIFAPLAAVSLYYHYALDVYDFRGTWYMFALGATLAWVVTQKIRDYWFWLFLIATVGGQFWRPDLPAAVTIATALSIYVCAKRNKMSSWLTWRPIQELGKISYSLYLCHYLVGMAVISVLLSYNDHSIFSAIFAYLAAVVLSIVAAKQLHYWVESPCIALAKRLKPARRAAAAATDAQASVSAPALDLSLRNREGGNGAAEDFKKIGNDFPPPVTEAARAKPAHAPTSARSSQKAGRLLFIDGLRGVAALLVMLFHFYTPKVSTIFGPLHAVVPFPLEWICMQGYVGVEIFFVLSGFVIAYTLRNDVCTPGFAANFMVRRSIRLDPPYWTVLAITVLYRCFLWHHYTGLILGSLGIRSVLLNMFYLAGTPSQPLWVGVAWTLCLEVRFYLCFIAILVISQQAARWISPGAGRWAFGLVFVPLTTVSIFHRYGSGELDFIGTWYMFAMGVTLAWAITGKMKDRWFWVVLFAALTGELWAVDFRAAIAVGAALMIYAAARLNKMSTWLSWGWCQKLGKISYSLYLIHVAVGMAVMDIFYSYGDHSSFCAVVTYIVASLLSLLAAHYLQLLVEGPCVNLAKLLKPARHPTPKAKEAAAPAVTAALSGQLATA
ncbi:MAG TPA: acyltransferase [Tepidisphaeraceae bacterium]|nr:acyltransferase [Tepidisphaeraceae bacterium]